MCTFVLFGAQASCVLQSAEEHTSLYRSLEAPPILLSSALKAQVLAWASGLWMKLGRERALLPRLQLPSSPTTVSWREITRNVAQALAVSLQGSVNSAASDLSLPAPDPRTRVYRLVPHRGPCCF